MHPLMISFGCRLTPAATKPAVAASTPTAVLQKNGMIGMVKQMTVTLTCDHRHIYGADAAKFLVDLADLLENDAISLLK